MIEMTIPFVKRIIVRITFKAIKSQESGCHHIHYGKHQLHIHNTITKHRRLKEMRSTANIPCLHERARILDNSTITQITSLPRIPHGPYGPAHIHHLRDWCLHPIETQYTICRKKIHNSCDHAHNKLYQCKCQTPPSYPKTQKLYFRRHRGSTCSRATLLTARISTKCAIPKKRRRHTKKAAHAAQQTEYRFIQHPPLSTTRSPYSAGPNMGTVTTKSQPVYQCSRSFSDLNPNAPITCRPIILADLAVIRIIQQLTFSTTVKEFDP